MGVSTDAILFYGYCWGDQHDLGEAGEDWVSVVFKRRGLHDPFATKEPFREQRPNEGWRSYDKERQAASDKWYADNDDAVKAYRQAINDIRGEFGCCVGSHCSGEYGMPYVYVVASHVIASRGCPEDATGRALVTRPDWDAMLERFMGELGIERPHESPRWWLVSYWG